MDSVNEVRRKRLLAFMRKHEIGNRELARVLDRAHSAVAYWRSGKRSVPDHTMALLEHSARTGELERAIQETRATGRRGTLLDNLAGR